MQEPQRTSKSAGVVNKVDGYCQDAHYARFERDLRDGKEPTLAFSVYLSCAIRHLRPIQAQRQGDGSTCKTATFQLLRLIKSHPDLRKLCAEDAFQVVDEAVMDLWQSANPCGQYGIPDLGLYPRAWSEVIGANREDAEAECLDGWNRIRFIPHLTPLQNAVERAKANPLELQPRPNHSRSSGYPKFVSLAGWLQVVRGNANILLPGRQVGEVLGVSAMTVTRYRRCAEEDKYIQLLKEHRRPNGGQPGDATEYRFDLSRFPELAALVAAETVEAGRAPGPVLERSSTGDTVAPDRLPN